MSERRLGLLMATITALSWAVLAIALKVALKIFSAELIVWIRLSLAFLILLALFSVKRKHWLEILKRPPWLGLLAAVLLAGNYYGFMKGIELTTASHAQIMIQLAPLSFAIISILMFRELPTRIQATGMILALCGFGFFYWDQILVSFENVSRFQLGNMWLIFGALTWTGFALIQKKLLKKYAPQQFNLLIYGVAALALVPTAQFSELPRGGPWDYVLLVFLALNTVIAYGALSEALPRIPASHVSMIIAVNPLLTLFIMTCLTRMEVEWIKGEPIGWRGLVGALLVVTGVICTVASPSRLSSGKASI